MDKAQKASETKKMRQKAEDLLKKKQSISTQLASESDSLKLIHELEVHQIELELQNEELRRTKESAEIASEKYTELYDFAPTGFFTVSKAGIILELNLSGATLLGRERSLLINSNFGFFVSPETKPIYNQFIDKVFISKVKETCELTLTNNNNEITHVILTGISNPNVEQCFITAIDFSVRVVAEETLKQQVEFNDLVLQTMMDGYILTNAEGKIIQVNSSYCNMVQYNRDELLQMNIYDIDVQFKQKEIVARTERFSRFGKDKFETKHKCKNGAFVDLEVSASILKRPDGEFAASFLRDITKRKQTEESLLEQSLFNEQIIRTAMDGFILAETDGKILKVNPSYCQMIGYTEQELLVMNINEFDVLESSKEIDQRIKKLIINGRDQFESIHKTKDGRNIDLSISIVITQSLEKPLVAAFIRDVTDQKNANIILKESEQKLRNIIENSTNLFYTHTPDHKLTYISPQVKEVIGYTEEEALIYWTKLVSDNPINELGYQYTKKAIDTGQKQLPYELELVKKNGEKIWVEVREAPLVKNGKTISIVGALIDITDRINAENTIIEREHLLSESQKVAHLGSYKLDFSTGFWESSEVLLEVFGIDSAYEANIDGWLKLIHPDDRKMMQTYFSENIIKKLEPFNKEYRIVRANDNKERWVLGLGKLEFDRSGELVKMIGTIQDITERKLIDNALKESEIKYRSLIENSNDAIYLLNDNKFEVINNKLTEIFGYTIDELNKPDFNFAHLIASKSKNLFAERQKQYESGDLRGNKYEIALIKKNGEEIEVEISDSFINYKDGKANQGYIRDITARKKQQEILINAIVQVQEDEKYKFGKDLHDGLGQILISASMYLESLGKIKEDLDDNKKKDLQQAQKLNKQAIMDARRISHGLMITGIDEHGLIHLIKQLCYNSGGPEINFRLIHKNVDEEKISSEFKMHLYRIIQELATNILKHSEATKARINIILKNENTLILIVSDNGNGFDQTKTGKGAGLSNIDQRITIMKGKKEIETEKGKGTKIIISIPLY